MCFDTDGIEAGLNALCSLVKIAVDGVEALITAMEPVLKVADPLSTVVAVLDQAREGAETSANSRETTIIEC